METPNRRYVIVSANYDGPACHVTRPESAVVHPAAGVHAAILENAASGPVHHTALDGLPADGRYPSWLRRPGCQVLVAAGPLPADRVRVGELATRSRINACSADPRWEAAAWLCGAAAKVLHGGGPGPVTRPVSGRRPLSRGGSRNTVVCDPFRDTSRYHFQYRTPLLGLAVTGPRRTAAGPAGGRGLPGPSANAAGPGSVPPSLATVTVTSYRRPTGSVMPRRQAPDTTLLSAWKDAAVEGRHRAGPADAAGRKRGC